MFNMFKFDRRFGFVVALTMAATASFGTYIQNVMTRTDLLDYCPGGVSSSMLVFQDSSGPFYASQDLTIAGLYVDWRNVTLELDSDRVIKLTGPVYGNIGNFTCVGGIYDFQSTYGFNTGWWDENVNRFGMTLDGAVFTNMPTVVLQNNAQAGGTWTMKNGARIHSSGVFNIVAWNGTAQNLLFEMTSGSRVTCGCFTTDADTARDGLQDFPHTLSLSGEGTSFSAQGSSENRIGNGYSYAMVTVRDHAALSLGGTTFIGTAAKSYYNALRLTGSATAVLETVYLGCNGGGSNVVEVADGSELTMSTCYLNGGNPGTKGNSFLVSNATVNAKVMFAPAGMGSDSTIRISGDRPKVRVDSGKIPYMTAFEMNGGVRMIFDIPRMGYVDDQVPIVVTGTYDNAGTAAERPMGTFVSDPAKLALELNGVAAYQEWLQRNTAIGKKRVVMLHAAGSIDGYDTAIAAANATLPERCRLYKTEGTNVGLANGMALVLEVKTRRGLIISIK